MVLICLFAIWLLRFCLDLVWVVVGLVVSDLVVCGCSAGGCVLGGFGFRWWTCVVWWQLGCLLFICSGVLVDCVLGYIRWVRLWLPRVCGCSACCDLCFRSGWWLCLVASLDLFACIGVGYCICGVW